MQLAILKLLQHALVGIGVSSPHEGVCHILGVNVSSPLYQRYGTECIPHKVFRAINYFMAHLLTSIRCLC